MTASLQTASPMTARLLREPLIHFLVLGALLFGIDHVLAARRDDLRVIRLNAAVDTELRTVFRDAQGRDPSAVEMTVLREHWLDTEILYREGLALRVDQGDSTIRDRVVFKALNVVQSNLKPPAIDEVGLREWFERNHSRYDTPPRVDLLEAVVVDQPDRQAADAFAEALNQGRQNDTTSGLRVFRQRPRNTIVDGFGEDFAAEIDTVPLNRWQVVDSRDGPRVVRVESRTAGQPARFEDLSTQVREDWEDEQMQQLRTAAVRRLSEKYRIVRETPTP